MKMFKGTATTLDSNRITTTDNSNIFMEVQQFRIYFRIVCLQTNSNKKLQKKIAEEISKKNEK